MPWRAFAELQTDRPAGMAGPLPIPWTAINAWALRHGIVDADEFAELVAYLRALDRVWLEQQAKTKDPD